MHPETKKIQKHALTNTDGKNPKLQLSPGLVTSYDKQNRGNNKHELK